MTRPALESMSVEELVHRFVEISVAQGRATDMHDTAKFNRLFDEKALVVEKHRSRPGDQRTALMPLHNHANLQVRLNAAKATLAVAPVESRRALEAIEATGWLPQSGDAGMSLWALDEGIFKPK